MTQSNFPQNTQIAYISKDGASLELVRSTSYKASGVVESLLPALTINDSTSQIDLPELTVLIFDNANFLGTPIRAVVPAFSATISSAGVRYILAVKYNGGSPVCYLETDASQVNMSNVIPLYTLERMLVGSTSTIHSIGFDTLGEGLAQKIEVAQLNVQPYRLSTGGGLTLSSVNRYISLTGGIVYAGNTPYSLGAFSSQSGNSLVSAYKVLNVWTYAQQTDGLINNTEYQGASDLVTMDNNKYKCVWVYRSVGDVVESFYVNGTGQYNTVDLALAETVPTPPSLLGWHCMLVGRIVIQKGATTASVVQGAANNNFVSGGGGGTTLTGGFFPTMDIASASSRVMPALNGSRSELLVLAAPRVDYKITQGSTTQFGIAILQGSVTGNIVLTLRDSQLRLIAQSYQLSSPSSNILQDIACGVVYDPTTGLSVAGYQLTAGTQYYIGINYSTNGCAYWGNVADETTNIQPVPAVRYDNLTDVPQTLTVGAGSESLIRPYIRLKG